MKIRLRLTLFGAVVVVAATVVFGSTLAWLAERTAPADQAMALGSVADEAAANINEAAPDALVPSSPPALVDLSTSTETFIMILDEAGIPLYSTARFEGTPPPIPAAVVVEALQQGASEATYAIGDDVMIHVQARRWERNDLGRQGVALAAQSTAFIQEQLDGLRGLIVVSVIITLLVAGAAGWIVSGRALRPLRELATTTDEIGATGDLSRRLPPTEARDEVGALTRSFNAMLTRLQTARGELTQSLQRQKQFVADASHELRSPLTTIRNNAGFLREKRDASTQDRQEAIEEIEAEAARMTTLVNDLLALARSDAELAPDRRPLDLADLVRETVGRNNAVTVHPGVPAEVEGDPEALRRLIVILVENAERHGGKPIEISVVNAADQVTLTVRDHGPGLATEEIERVFDRFHQADPSRNPEGAGLGLAIAREIARAHGGSIAAANHPGGGAAFEVVLPALQAG